MGQFLQFFLEEWWLKALSKSPAAILPVLVCQVFGGSFRDALPVLVAWRLLCLAAKLFDDVEDGDTDLARPEHINMATSLLFLAQLALAKLSATGLTLDKIEQIRSRLNKAGLIACNGQYLEFSRNSKQVQPDPDGWLEVALAKSGYPFAWATWAGGMVAGASEVDLQAMWMYGFNLGIIRQVTDDIQDIWNGVQVGLPAKSLSCLPFCYISWVLQGSERDNFIKLLSKMDQKDFETISRLREVIDGSGTEFFVNAVVEIHVNQALKALQGTGLSQESLFPLRRLLDVIPSCTTPHES